MSIKVSHNRKSFRYMTHLHDLCMWYMIMIMHVISHYHVIHDNALVNTFKALSQGRVCRTCSPTSPPPQKLLPYLHKTCPVCWTEWKINFQIFIFRVMVDFVFKINRKMPILSIKMTVSQKLKIINIWKLIFHSVQHIPQLPCKFDHFFLILMHVTFCMRKTEICRWR